MATGYFGDDQVTTPLLQVVQNRGTDPARPAGNAATENYVGAIRTFAFNFVPGGYQANGDALAIAQNTALFNVEGIAFGGDGTTTFDLPNLQGTVAVGATGNRVGAVTGSDVVSVDASQFPTSLGGVSSPIALGQPSQAVQYLICTSGTYPSPDSKADQAFLGEVIAFTGGIIPSGFSLANGAAVNIDSNFALFSVIGLTYGGDGINTFNLPNLQGRDIVGAGGYLYQGDRPGNSNVTLTQANLPLENGGIGQAFFDRQPGLALNYLISVDGIYPSTHNAAGGLDSFPYLGEVRAYAGFTVPKGWMLAAGQTLSIAGNTALYSILGNTYGGDGRETFKLPDLRDKVVVGSGTRNGVTYAESVAYGSNTATLVVTDATSGPRAADNVFLGDTSASSTLMGGTAANSFFTLGGPTRIEGGPGHDTIFAPVGEVTVVSGTGGSLIGLGAGRAVVTANGQDTVIAGTGAVTIAAAARSLIALGAGPAIVAAAADSTVIGGGGADTVAVSGSGVTFFAGGGRSEFLGGLGNSTVVGGLGSATLFGGAGGGLLSGGSAGGNVIVAGQQATTIFGGGDNDVLFATGAAGDVIVAGAGNATLQGGGSSGNNLFFAGSGDNVVGLGSGQNTVLAGTGASTVIAGLGHNVFAFSNGNAGSTETILGFRLGSDRIALGGYAPNEVTRTLASATSVASTVTSPGGSRMTLSDGTHVIFVGLDTLDARIFG